MQLDFFSVSAQPCYCGVDEAGRGPLAGPVVAAAVVLDPDKPIDGLNDSKKLTARRREQLAQEIKLRARVFAVAEADVAEIERLNILHASMLAMSRAIKQVYLQLPQLAQVRVDGNRCPQTTLDCQAVVGGDASDPAIAAASILAKVSRDAWIVAADKQHPQYGFAKHKGYPTPAHLAALQAHGPCPIHRRGFAPVKRLLS